MITYSPARSEAPAARALRGSGGGRATVVGGHAAILIRVPVWTVAATAMLCCGCMTGPDYERPDIPVPDAWSEPLEQGETSGAAVLDTWWSSFGDVSLDSLVARAVAGNFDLQIAESRLKQARAYEDIAGAALWPQVNTAAAYHRSQTPEVDTQGRNSGSVSISPTGLSVAETMPGPFGTMFTLMPDLTGSGMSRVTISPGVSPPDRHNDRYQAGFDASWELDIFGGVQREREAARADTSGVEELRRDVFISVAAEVARNYFLLRSAQHRLETAGKNIEAQEAALNLARARFGAGLTNELDVKFAEAQLASSKSVVPVLETYIQAAIHRLGILIGGDPGTLQEELAVPAALTEPPPEVPVGLPADILRRRPDVRRAERTVAAATARIGAAQADLYPHFMLTGSLTGSSSTFDGITRGANRIWSLGPGIRWPIFDAGRIRANIRVQDARQEEAITTYEKTVKMALEEVENALVAYAKEQNRLISLTEAVNANRRAVEIATQLYTSGLLDFLHVLDAERSLFASEDLQLQSEALVLTNLVALYKALGGGWETTYPEALAENTATPAAIGNPPAP